MAATFASETTAQSRVPRVLGIFVRSHWAVRLGSTGSLTIIVLLLLTPFIAPYDPSEQDIRNRLDWPSAAHWLGTDQFGRDILSRVLYGGLFSVSIAAVTLILSAVIGMAIGAIAARAGGIVDEVVMRTSDLLIAFPDIVIALFLISLLGADHVTLIIALTIGGWMPFALVMRALTLELNSKDFIVAAEALGCSKWFIVTRHIIPNTLGPILAMAFLRYGHNLIIIGGLSFIGLGVQPPASDWGAMLSEGRSYMDRMIWIILAPGLAIFITALAVTLVGKGLEFGRFNRQIGDHRETA